MHEQVSRMLSSFLDDELTQAEAQRVEVHLEDCEDCRRAFSEMQGIRRAARSKEFPTLTRDQIERLEDLPSVRVTRMSGWFLVILTVAVWSGYAVYQFVTGEIDMERLLNAGLIAGLVLLLVSVVRQRLLELPRDRYRRVKR